MAKKAAKKTAKKTARKQATRPKAKRPAWDTDQARAEGKLRSEANAKAVCRGDFVLARDATKAPEGDLLDRRLSRCFLCKCRVHVPAETSAGHVLVCENCYRTHGGKN